MTASIRRTADSASRAGCLAGLVVLLVAASATFAADSSNDKLKAPPLPAIERIVVEPATVAVHDALDGRKVLVFGIGADGQRYDLTSQAKFKPQNAAVQVDDDGFVYAAAETAAGQASITVEAMGKQATFGVNIVGAAQRPIGFVRDVMPIMAKTGCNQGTCHGAQNGKNGFKLSLRGYDPDEDYQHLISDISGRRFNRVDPAQSLMLLKPIAEVPHEGRQALVPGSRHYNTLLQWIKEGTRREEAALRATSIEVFPREVQLDLPGRSQEVVVIAHYGDGSTRDVTREAIIATSNIEVTRADDNVITGLRRGESGVLVRYEGSYATALITVMGDRSGYEWVQQPVYNEIDTHVDTKLKKIKAIASEVCDDATFVRRAYLDLTGIPPTPETAFAFVEDKTPSREKRAKLVDQLIGSDDFVEFWANKWADLLQCNSAKLGDKGVWAFRSWIRREIASNRPYDQFVRDLIDARGSTYRNPAASYLFSLSKDIAKPINVIDTGKMTEDITQTFLGTRFNCNKCHDHPFERWTQTQYYEVSAYFSRVTFKNGEQPGEVVLFTNFGGGEIQHPKTNMNVAPHVPFGEAADVSQSNERRDAFVDWLVSKDNPLFARSYVNRVWSYFFGKGIIDPVDDIRAGNPASNPELLDWLTNEFVARGFDSQWLMRTIVNSRTYQLSVATNKWNEDDKLNFSHAYPRRLSAEQLLDAVAIATGTQPNVQGLPPQMRAVYAPDGLVRGNDFLKLFGRPNRESACECERTDNVSLAHALNLINGSTVNDAVTNGGGRIAKLVREEPDNAKVVTEIYYAILNRPPTDAELKSIDLGDGNQRLEVAQDLAWALFNSSAFLFNR